MKNFVIKKSRRGGGVFSHATNILGISQCWYFNAAKQLRSEAESSLALEGRGVGRGCSAFTLPEMMVVMLVMSIIMAAMAPVMTTRMQAQKANEQTSPWHWAENKIDAYFNGRGTNQNNARAMIGQLVGTDAEDARLIINTSDARPNHILFKKDSTILGRLSLTANNLLLGSLKNDGSVGSETIAVGKSINAASKGAVVIGREITVPADRDYSVSIGSWMADTTGNEAIAIGLASNATGTDSVAIGSRARAIGEGAVSIGQIYSDKTDYGAVGNKSIAIGVSTKASASSATAIGNMTEATGDEATAIGVNARATGYGSIAIGRRNPGDAFKEYGANGNRAMAIGTAKANGITSIAFGEDAKSMGTNSIAIGSGAYAEGKDAEDGGIQHHLIAIGADAHSQSEQAIAIGRSSFAQLYGAIALGSYSSATSYGSIAIGSKREGNDSAGISSVEKAEASGIDSIAIGSAAKAVGTYNIAIGTNACQYVTGSNKICIGANSGPKSGHEWAKEGDNTERIFIGSKSKFNDGPAVLEVHNESAQVYNALSDTGHHPVQFHKTGVVINGNLVVKGTIVTQLPKEDDDGLLQYGAHRIKMLATVNDDKYPRLIKLNDAFGTYYAGDNGAFGGPEGGLHTGNWSDRRLKYVGTESKSGLDKIRQLKIFNYTFKKDEKKTPHVGVIAQDLQKVFPDAVTKGDDGFLRIRMEDMFYAVINAIKELDSKVSQLLKQETEKDKRIKKLEAQNKALEARLKALEAKVK